MKMAPEVTRKPLPLPKPKPKPKQGQDRGAERCPQSQRKDLHVTYLRRPKTSLKAAQISSTEHSQEKQA